MSSHREMVRELVSLATSLAEDRRVVAEKEARVAELSRAIQDLLDRAGAAASTQFDRDPAEPYIQGSFTRAESVTVSADEHLPEAIAQTIKVAQDRGEPVTADDVAAALGISRNAAWNRLTRACEAKRMEKAERGLYRLLVTAA
jgi:hypothetical protein